ncbi:MAG TPA: DUF4199 domain-containing protein [Saprospiraceae bacterium]|nr:DUF4199 domain-containing protein [Saprospiraceae bacterium]
MSNPSIKYGVYAGVIIILLDLILYLIDERIFLLASTYVALPVIIVAMVYSSRDYKAANGGIGSFKELFTASWLSYLIAGLISTAFTYILYNFIAPNLIETMREITMEGIEKMKGMLPEESYEAALEQMDANKNPMGFSSIILSLLVRYALAAIPAMIVAASMKKEADPFA